MQNLFQLNLRGVSTLFIEGFFFFFEDHFIILHRLIIRQYNHQATTVNNQMIVQTSSSVHSPARLFKSTSAFFNTMLEKRLPIPLMAVMANITLRLPSMLVLRIRRMCWNFSGMTKDWKTTNWHYVWIHDDRNDEHQLSARL